MSNITVINNYSIKNLVCANVLYITIEATNLEKKGKNANHDFSVVNLVRMDA